MFVYLFCSQISHKTIQYKGCWDRNEANAWVLTTTEIGRVNPLIHRPELMGLRMGAWLVLLCFKNNVDVYNVSRHKN
jgi:hypothetical protein